MDLSDFFKNKTFLVCGGTGSIGSEIVRQLLKYDPKTVRILSNSENELWETSLLFSKYEDKLRYLLGDIRNYERIRRAIRDVDYVFNTAAIKHVPFSEYNPIESVNVNIIGLENIIEACLENNVKRMIHISTDKAVSPTSVMGATKMIGERVCTARDYAKGSSKTKISCVRFGNVLGSRGSIVPLIEEQIKNGDQVTLTDENMTRYVMSISQAAELVLKAMFLSQGGEIFVLKMPVVRIIDLIEILIELYAPKFGKNPKSIKIKKIGSRNGEKLYESLISPLEKENCYEYEDMFVIFPNNFLANNVVQNRKLSNLKKAEDVKFSSADCDYLSKEEIKSLMEEIN